MFVGFIAVVVILLVVVGLMSTGATNGSGGSDQTKATKAVSEISALAQATGFYKTTQINSDYTGLSVAAMQASGIIDAADLVDVTTLSNVGADAAGTVPASGNVIKSKAVKGLYYNIAVDGTSTKNFNVTVLADADDIPAAGTLAAALDSTYNKLADTAVVTNDATVEGTAVIKF